MLLNREQLKNRESDFETTRKNENRVIDTNEGIFIGVEYLATQSARSISRSIYIRSVLLFV